MPRRPNTSVNVVSRSEMLETIEEFYYRRTPGDDRDDGVIASIREAGPIEVMTAYAQIETATKAVELQKRLKRRLVWASVACTGYAAGFAIVMLRFWLNDKHSPTDLVLGLIMASAVILALIAYSIANVTTRRRRVRK